VEKLLPFVSGAIYGDWGMKKQAPSMQRVEIPSDTRIAVIAARFNADFVDELLAGCQRRLAELKVSAANVSVYRVPGAFELPVAAQSAARTGRFAAIICLGCVIRGETPHFDYVAGEAAHGIQQVAISTGLPVIFGVLTTNNADQARDRLGGAHGHAGERAADAAVEMIAVTRSMVS
jgi:6,7-dimethyl-8-ribityllumazine synthase